MPDTTGRISPSTPPTLVLSERGKEDVGSPARPTLASRRRSKTESAALEGSGRLSTIAWLDTADPARQRKKAVRRSARRSSESLSGDSRSRRNTDSGADRFFPRLGRIVESSESRSTSRPGTSGSDSRKAHERTSPRKARQRDDGSVGYRRPVKHKVGGVSRRHERPFKVNPSLLSVLSSMTGTSDKSSSSSTTITQLSYVRGKGGCAEDTADPQAQHPLSDAEAKKLGSPTVSNPMEPNFVDDAYDGESVYSSSSSSQYEPSEAGSSDHPGTPSSQSSFPSPTATRNPSLSGSVAELRRKYDAQHASSTTSRSSSRRGSQSPETHVSGQRRLPRVRDAVDGNDESIAGSRLHSNGSFDEQTRPRTAKRPEDTLRYQEEALRRHLAQSQQPQDMVDPIYGQHRSQSTSSQGSSGSSRAYHAQYMAMQQYQYSPTPPPMGHPIPPQAVHGHAPSADRPPVPDAPDLSQRTIIGYEQLALELANDEASIRPLYRKFDYLNHRILLHMQDELCEMEEQLRTVDEIIAQMEPSPADGQQPPSSRRSDAFHGTEMHHRRTALLGRIFMKTEQYNRAMSSFASLNKDCPNAELEQVAAYRSWLHTKSSIHEVETRFLQREKDLVLPGAAKPLDVSYRPTKHAALTCLPVALMLPLLLFAIIPTFLGRLVVTALIAVGALMVTSSTRLRHLMPANEWAVCGGVYVLLMAAIAGCIPQHAR